MPMRRFTARHYYFGRYRRSPAAMLLSRRDPRPAGPRRTLLIVVGVVTPLAVIVGAGAVLAAARQPPPPDPAATPNPNCTLVVPADPLSAKGLATPYQLVATQRRAGQCHESEAAQAAFVEAAVLDPATGKISIYHPLVSDQGRRPAAQPVAPVLPAGAVVGIWFGSNGETLTLRGTRDSLAAGHCVNGLNGSLFGQYAYCNATAFFTAANAAIAAKKLVVPRLGTGRDGLACPTVRDFSVVDQDQSDNVVSSYLVLKDGRMAPNTAANRASLGDRATVLSNGSDNGLVDRFVDPALGCTPPTAPDLGDPGAMSSSLALNELSAAATQPAPSALVPTNDPMTLADGKVSVAKTNLYRAGVDQPRLTSARGVGRLYCDRMVRIAPARLRRDRRLFLAAPSPDPDAAANLFGFLAQRLHSSFDLLGCQPLLHRRNPIRLQADPAGKVADAVPVDPSGSPVTAIPSGSPSDAAAADAAAVAAAAADPAAPDGATPPTPDPTPTPVPNATPEPSVSAKHY